MTYTEALNLYLNGSFFSATTAVYDTPTNGGASWLYAMIIITIMIVLYARTNNSVFPAIFGVLISGFVIYLFPPALYPLLFTIVPITVGLVLFNFILRAKG